MPQQHVAARSADARSGVSRTSQQKCYTQLREKSSSGRRMQFWERLGGRQLYICSGRTLPRMCPSRQPERALTVLSCLCRMGCRILASQPAKASCSRPQARGARTWHGHRGGVKSLTVPAGLADLKMVAAACCHPQWLVPNLWQVGSRIAHSSLELTDNRLCQGRLPPMHGRQEPTHEAQREGLCASQA